MTSADDFIHDKLSTKAIVILDGGLGTELRNARLTEADYCGALELPTTQAQQGNCALLSLTQPSLVQAQHERFIAAGADIIQTNTFCANRLDQARFYGIADSPELIAEMNRQSMRIALDAVKQSGRNTLVCGSIGPTHAAVTIGTFEHVGFDELVDVYCEQIRALVEAGCRVFLVESVMDWVNARAAMTAIEQIEIENGEQLRAIVSAGIGAKSGRLLSGQSGKAFARVFSAYPNVLAVGMNCGDCAPDLGTSTIGHVRDGSRVPVAYYPCAGLPNKDGVYALSPGSFAEVMAKFVGSGMVDIVGGCCGITPGHIEALAKLCDGMSRRSNSVLGTRGTIYTVSGDGNLPNIDLASSLTTDDIANAIQTAIMDTGSPMVRVQIVSSEQTDKLLGALSKQETVELDCVLVIDPIESKATEVLLQRAPCMCLINTTTRDVARDTCARWIRLSGAGLYLADDLPSSQVQELKVQVAQHLQANNQHSWRSI